MKERDVNAIRNGIQFFQDMINNKIDQINWEKKWRRRHITVQLAMFTLFTILDLLLHKPVWPNVVFLLLAALFAAISHSRIVHFRAEKREMAMFKMAGEKALRIYLERKERGFE